MPINHDGSSRQVGGLCPAALCRAGRESSRGGPRWGKNGSTVNVQQMKLADWEDFNPEKPIDFPGYRKKKPMNLLYHNFQGIVYKPYTIDFPGYRKNKPYTIDFPGYRKNKPMNLLYHMTGRVNIEKNHLWMGVSIGLLTAGVSTQDEYNHLNSGLFDRVPGARVLTHSQLQSVFKPGPGTGVASAREHRPAALLYWWSQFTHIFGDGVCFHEPETSDELQPVGGFEPINSCHYWELVLQLPDREHWLQSWGLKVKNCSADVSMLPICKTSSNPGNPWAWCSL